jgi:hypothetical protein
MLKDVTEIKSSITKKDTKNNLSQFRLIYQACDLSYEMEINL